MDINTKLLKPITETKYLSEINCARYRPILRYFYQQYEKIKYWLHKEDIFEELKKHSHFENYTIELCKQDLDALVTWGNIVPVQDPSRAATVEEFKNKQFRYHLSEYSVEIERLTIRLENLFVEGASLEASLFEKLLDEISKMSSISNENLNIIDTWWRDLNADFKRLNQNYQDYMRSFYSLKAEERMKTKEFIAYKDALINYLRDFVKGLQKYSYMIEKLLKNIPTSTVEMVLWKVVEYEKSIPRLDVEVSESDISDNVFGRWKSIQEWFISDEHSQSEVARVLDLTNEIIRKITRYAAQIAESRNSAANRKEEYKRLCSMFIRSDSMEEAHKLSAVVFGIFNMRHIRGDIERMTESISSSVYDEKPLLVEIRPRVRTYKDKAMRSGIEDKTERKTLLHMEYIKNLEQEKTIMESYIKDNKLDIAQLPVVERNVRVTILRWISRALIAADYKAKTEEGREYRLFWNSERYCTLKSVDGQLEIPAFQLEFEESI